MRSWNTATMLVLLATNLVACVDHRESVKRANLKFMQTASGEYTNEAGDRLMLVPVYARMIGLDTMYVERTTKNGTAGRLLVLEPTGHGNDIAQIAYVFTQPDRWRNLVEQPELLSALQPNDVRAAGSCDIQLAKDHNSLSYSCSGSAPQKYDRVQHKVPE
jgi:hypothetical protein